MAEVNISKVEVSGKQFPVVEFKGERILTFAMIDEMHERQEGTARKRFNENGARFLEGKHFHVIDHTQKSVFRTFGINVPNRGLIALTERGYLMLAKSLTDDKAWEVQDRLIDGYFRAKSSHPPVPPSQPLLGDQGEQWYLAQMVGGAIVKMVKADEPCAVKYMRLKFPHLEVITKAVMAENLRLVIGQLSEICGQFTTLPEVSRELDHAADAYFARQVQGGVA